MKVLLWEMSLIVGVLWVSVARGRGGVVSWAIVLNDG